MKLQTNTCKFRVFVHFKAFVTSFLPLSRSRLRSCSFTSVYKTARSLHSLEMKLKSKNFQPVFFQYWENIDFDPFH